MLMARTSMGRDLPIVSMSFFTMIMEGFPGMQVWSGTFLDDWLQNGSTFTITLPQFGRPILYPGTYWVGRVTRVPLGTWPVRQPRSGSRGWRMRTRSRSPCSASTLQTTGIVVELRCVVAGSPRVARCGQRGTSWTPGPSSIDWNDSPCSSCEPGRRRAGRRPIRSPAGHADRQPARPPGSRPGGRDAR